MSEKVKKLDFFNDLNIDHCEYSQKVKVVFLNRELLDMADNYKNTFKNESESLGKEKINKKPTKKTMFKSS